MKKIYSSSKLARKIILAFIFAVFLVAGGCYTIAYIIQPTEVAPNSSFNVKIAVIPEPGNDLSDYSPGYGILGVLLPEGWMVKDSLEYCENNGLGQKGCYNFNSDVVSFLNAHFGKPHGYFWWGAKSQSLIDIAYLDTGFINLTIITNENTGQFKIKYVLGDDNDWHKSSETVLYGIVQESTNIPITVGITSNARIANKNKEWEVFPNPATNKVTFAWNQKYELLNLELYQINGTCVLDKVISSNENVSLENFPKGVYLYKLADKHKVLNSGKLVIQ